jgi:predicted permease
VSWRTAWLYSRPAYFELAFQSIYGLRRGNPLPGDPSAKLVAKARRRVIQSKTLVSVVLGLVILASVATLASGFKAAVAPDLPAGLYVAGVLSLTLIAEFSFLWWTGLQLLPTYLTSGIVPLFETLPVDRRTVDHVAAILLFRMFDAPALTALILTPLAVGLFLGSALAGLAILPGVLSVVVLATALALATGRFFVRRVQGAGGGSRRTVLRWTYLVLWAIPALALYAFLAFSGQFFDALGALNASGVTWALSLLAAVYPMAFAALPAAAAAGIGSGAFPPGFSELWVATCAAAYGVVVVALGVWLTRQAGEIVRETNIARQAETRIVRPLAVRTSVLAVLWKDVRTASRTPGYAFLLLLPVLDAIAIGCLTFISTPGPARVFNLAVAAVATAALLATFFGPAFFAVETMAFSYTRTLPISQRSMLAGKVLLISLVYLVAAACILALAGARVFSLGLLVLFIAAALPGVVAAASLEYLLLFRRAWKSGVPIVNLYTAAWYAAAVTIPGVAITLIPLFTFFATRSLGDLAAIGWMAIAGLIELACLLPIVLPLGRRVSG